MSALVEALRAATLYDVSPVIDERLPVFPGHPPIEIRADERTHDRDGYFLQHLSFGEHLGSHVDAPAHAVAQLADRTIDRFPVDRFLAPYVKYDLTAFALRPGDLVSAEQLQEVEERDGVAPEAGDIAIAQFGWDAHFRPESDDADERAWWIRNAPGLAADACEHLVARGVTGVGSDTATCDSAVVDGVITSDVGHSRWFLPNGILIFEGLIGLGRAPASGTLRRTPAPRPRRLRLADPRRPRRVGPMPDGSIRDATAVEIPGGRARLVVEQDGQRRLCLPAAVHGFEGPVVETDEGALRLVAPTRQAAARLRELAPALRPRPLGGARSSFGFGDRIGLATAGHVLALRASGARVAPVLAQQSARELERTGRSFVDVLDAATWGALETGWTSGYGADADHLRTEAEVADAVAAGFTMLTLDPSAHIHTAAARAAGIELEHRIRALPWDELGDDWPAMRRRHDRTAGGDEHELARVAATFGHALAHLARLSRSVPIATSDLLDVEVSVDETDLPTSELAHRFLARELRRLSIRFTGLAPRFPGVWQKGVDVAGDLDEVARAVTAHARVAVEEGGHKVSVHSGSDKVTLYPLLADADGASWHVKTSGTSYLEALRVVAASDPTLFREVLGIARSRLDVDRASYAIAPTATVPEPSTLADARLPALLDDVDARQGLHVTFGSVLGDGRRRGAAARGAAPPGQRVRGRARGALRTAPRSAPASSVSDVFSLEGRVAVVTGGTGAIGGALAAGLAGAGARVVVLARHVDAVAPLEAAAADDQTVGVAADVLDRASLEAARDAVVERFGAVHVLVNCAGRQPARRDAAR